MTLSTALIRAGNLAAEERAAGEEQAETLRSIFHGLALAVLELCDNLEREKPC